MNSAIQPVLESGDVDKKAIASKPDRSLLRLIKLNQFYGQSHTLRGVDLDVFAGECLVVMGRNGVGKTTLLKSVMGLVPVASGDIEIDGESYRNKPVESRARNGVGYVPQGRQIFPLLTVEENLRTGLVARKSRSRQLPDSIFELFPVLDEIRKRRGGDLSGGQQQQLAIARAMVTEPSVLLLDEPSEGIQPNIVSEIGQVIRTLTQERNLGVLLVEQKLPFARKFGDRFVLMDRGSCIADGTMDSLSDGLVKKYLSV